MPDHSTFKVFFDGACRLCVAMNKLVRPVLTFVLVLTYNAVLIWAVKERELSVSEFIAAAGPSNGMVLGFWFAEKAVLKDPKTGNTHGAGDD
ncbi:hypothetical protein [Herbaspirillum huttiense]|uniref:DUF393 domain-containing protein n=1 Tax=Herbaspirillum huttiense subsp. lycopersici TaxID=3074428 RepID=A0ABU2EFT7_9BURK|nr:hypothetical protein [Herbaspirillum huttiense]MDR9846999.1 hypothetical protein [Herbaspirillum huttiense SE1]